jgi:hypothetical protein
MAYWNNPPEREDGDGHDETADDVVRARRWLRKEASNRTHRDPLFGMLSDLELTAEQAGFYLGTDYDDDRDDVDEIGPF